jgi:hypothetical protein
MKIKRQRQGGFVMILVIFAMAMVSLYMIVLAGSSNTFLFQADRAYLDACRQNLIASGLAWSKKNVKTLKTAAGAVELDTSEMNVKTASLSIAASTGQKGKAQVEINTSCNRGRQTVTSSGKFAITANTVPP